MFSLGIIDFSAAAAAKTIGYLLGGRAAGGGASTSMILKMIFSTEVTSTSGTTLPGNQFAGAGVSSSTKGYDLGGSTSGAVIYALTFSGETTATLGATLSQTINNQGGAQSSSAGYSIGGTHPGGAAQNRIDKLTFSGETISTLGTNNSYTGATVASVSGPLAGYTSGGANPTTPLTSVSKLVFSTDVSASNANSLSQSRIQHFGVYSSSKGYWAGGFDNAGVLYYSSIEAVTFSNDTIATLGATITARGEGGNVSSDTRGYFQGGSTLVTNGLTTNEYIAFSGETVGTAANALSSGVFGTPSGVQV